MDVNLFQAEGSAESDERFRHLRDDVRSFSSGSANARIVKENHLMIRRKAIGYVRIPAVHVGIEVLQKEQRNRARFAESAIGEADSVSLYELCRRRSRGYESLWSLFDYCVPSLREPLDTYLNLMCVAC
jgi:hypothetical protein